MDDLVTALIPIAAKFRAEISDEYSRTGDPCVGREFVYRPGYIFGLDVEITFRVREPAPIVIADSERFVANMEKANAKLREIAPHVVRSVGEQMDTDALAALKAVHVREEDQ